MTTRIRNLASTTLAIAFLMAASANAHAEAAPPVDPVTPSVIAPAPTSPAASLTVSVAPQPAVDFTAEDADRASISGVRLGLEFVGTAVGAGLASYGTLVGICGDRFCTGGVLAAAGVNLVATPLLTYGIGRLGRGRGTLAAAFAGAGFGLLAGSTAALKGGQAAAIVGGLTIPLFSALFVEMSSGAASVEMKKRLGVQSVAPYAAPVALTGDASGETFGFAGTF
jgi:hypothetical protein